MLNARKEALRRDGHEEFCDVISALCNAVYRDGTPMSEHDAIGVLIGFLFAGQHTSLFSTSWTLLYLASHAPQMQKARAEMSEVLDPKGGTLSLEHTNHLCYIEACVKESLRLHPPLIVLMRKALQDVKVGEFVVPKGHIVACSPLLSHRTEDVYHNCEEWDPDRFLPQRNEGSAPHAYISFGGGTHRCLGERFAILQTKAVVATILESFDLQTVSGKAPLPDYSKMVVGPREDDCNVIFTRREGMDD